MRGSRRERQGHRHAAPALDELVEDLLVAVLQRSEKRRRGDQLDRVPQV